jgi:hypothetical protein
MGFTELRVGRLVTVNTATNCRRWLLSHYRSESSEMLRRVDCSITAQKTWIFSDAAVVTWDIGYQFERENGAASGELTDPSSCVGKQQLFILSNSNVHQNINVTCGSVLLQALQCMQLTLRFTRLNVRMGLPQIEMEFDITFHLLSINRLTIVCLPYLCRLAY